MRDIPDWSSSVKIFVGAVATFHRGGDRTVQRDAVQHDAVQPDAGCPCPNDAQGD